MPVASHVLPHRVSADEWQHATGWQLKPEGWCHDDRCVPASVVSADSSGKFDAVALAAATSRDRVAVGPEFGALSGAAAGAPLPSIVLQDSRGNEVNLRSLATRQRRLVLYAWGPW
jgi:hypothetical protein